LNEKTRIIEGDAFTWAPEGEKRFDTIWADIWNTSLAASYHGMATLRERFTPYLAPGGWLGVWQEASALVDHSRESLK
jgi:spermidine synthase